MSLPSNTRCCHHTGFMKKCKALVTSGKCERWVHVIGVDKNTGEEVNRHGCVDDWHVSLTIENTAATRHTAAAVESFRNSMVAQNAVLGIVHSPQPEVLMLNGNGEDVRP